MASADVDNAAPLNSSLRSLPDPRPGFVALSLDGAVDGRAAEAEQLGDLGDAVLAAVYQRDQVRFLAPVEFRLLAAQAAFGLGDFRAQKVRPGPPQMRRAQAAAEADDTTQASTLRCRK